MFCAEKSITWLSKLSGDLAIFAFLSTIFSKQFVGCWKHANLEFMQLCDIILHAKVGRKLVIIKTHSRPAGATHSNVGRMSEMCVD